VSLTKNPNLKFEKLNKLTTRNMKLEIDEH